jgi:mono/diheme cytochrome c family protein
MKQTFIRIVLAGLLLVLGLLAGCGGGGEAGAASSVAKTPAAPTGLVAVGGVNKVTLTWDPVAGADTFNIYWSITPGVTPASGSKISGATSPYEHLGLYVSQTYFYIVTAVTNGVESVASSQAATVAATDGANLYVTHCAGCHGPALTTTITNGTVDKIKAAIAADRGGMGSLSTLTAEQVNSIAAQLPCH